MSSPHVKGGVFSPSLTMGYLRKFGVFLHGDSFLLPHSVTYISVDLWVDDVSGCAETTSSGTL